MVWDDPARGALSDRGAVALRRLVDGCLGVLLLLTVALGLLWACRGQLPRALEELSEAVVFPAALFALVLFFRVQAGSDLDVDLPAVVARRVLLLRGVVGRLEGGLLQRSRHHATVAGHLDGQPVGVRVWVDPAVEPPVCDSLVCHVVFDGALRCRLERRRTEAEKRGDAAGGPPKPTDDDWLTVEGEAPRAVRRDLATRRELLALFDTCKLTRVVFDHDGLTAEVPANAYNLEPVRVAALLRRLIAFCRACDVIPRVTTARVAVAPRASAETCPYCRDEIHPGARAHCYACRTPHHDACLDEAGCTVLGCRGARPRGERARA